MCQWGSKNKLFFMTPLTDMFLF